MKRYLVFVCGSMLLAATGNTLAQSFTISGDLSLPAGIVSSQGAVTYRVSTDPLQEFEIDGSPAQSSTTVTIPRLRRISSYLLFLQDNESVDDIATVKLKFECISGCSNVAVTSTGFWSEDDGVVTENQATEFATDDDSLVDIELERGDVYSGVIKLPEEFEASGDETIQLLLRGSSFGASPEYTIEIDTEEDDTEWPFFIVVPRIASVGGWNMELSCNDCDEDIPAEKQLPTTAAGDPLTLQSNEAFFFRKFVNFNNMTLTFVSTRQPEASFPITGVLPLLLDED